MNIYHRLLNVTVKWRISKNGKIVAISVAIIVIIVASLFYIQNKSNERIQNKEVQRIITTKICNFTICYSESIKYEKEDFGDIVKNWSKFSNYTIEKVMKRYEGQNVNIEEERGYYITNNSTVIVEFHVTNKIWKNGDKYYADFLWLLNPFNLDFIDSEFKETNHGLYWCGKLNNVSTEINVLLPPQKVVYKAWGSDVGHCHGHVWWSSEYGKT